MSDRPCSAERGQLCAAMNVAPMVIAMSEMAMAGEMCAASACC